MKTVVLDTTYKLVPTKQFEDIHWFDDEAKDVQLVRNIKQWFYKGKTAFLSKPVRLVLPSIKTLSRILNLSKHQILEAFKELSSQDYIADFADYTSPVIVRNQLAYEVLTNDLAENTQLLEIERKAS